MTRFGQGQVRKVWNKKPIEIRLLNHLIKENGCWTTDLAKDKRGYGRLGRLLVHRVAFEYFNNTKIPKNVCVLHHCDNPSCVNPNHLYLGTRTENGIDMRVRKRVEGSKNGYAKLTEEKVLEIRKIYPKLTYAKLAKKYKVSVSNIEHIIQRTRWDHI